MKPETIARKKAKPPGACSNAWCGRKPRPGGKTCERCREYLNRWARENRPSRTEKPRPS